MTGKFLFFLLMNFLIFFCARELLFSMDNRERKLLCVWCSCLWDGMFLLVMDRVLFALGIW